MSAPSPEVPSIQLVSPTGQPLIPPSAVKYLTAGGAIVVALSEVIPPYTVVGHLLSIFAKVVGLIGLASPGLRLGK